MATLSTFSSWKGRSALLKGAGLIHNVWYFLFTISSNLHYSNKNYAFLPHLWQKIIGNSKGEGSLKPVISNQLGSAWKTTFPKLMVPILCNFYIVLHDTLKLPNYTTYQETLVPVPAHIFSTCLPFHLHYR